MNTNIDYLGLLALLRRLLALELINDSEAKKIAVRLRVDMGADIAVFLWFFSFGYGYFWTSMILCVAEQGVTVE